MAPTLIPFDEIRAWMLDAALPLWADVGVDQTRKGFVEQVDMNGRPLPPGFRRTRVAGRQTYVFSHAAERGWGPGERVSAFGAEILDRLYCGPDQGWPRTSTSDGAVLDPTPDLYDLAFVLFGYAWRHRASRDPDALRGAHRALDFIERRLRAPHGYWHEAPATGPRLQNPHMHLLEACIAAFESSQDERFLSTARDLVALFRSAFFDGRTLAEFFAEDWRRAPGELGRLIEPGHQFEWAWILVRYGRYDDGDLISLAQALVDFPETRGRDAAGRVVQVVRDDGLVIDASSRTWPNTERIKAHLALFEAAGRDPRPAVAASARTLLDQYLATDVRGLWIDHLDAFGRPLTPSVPASTLYHLHLAFAEVLRLESALRTLA